MIERGLKAEALSLIEYRTLPVMNTVGYQEWYAQSEESDSDIEAQINAHTRQYARRQTTWFSKFKKQIEELNIG
jgi:tRNA dimethylallyltransferase